MTRAGQLRTAALAAALYYVGARVGLAFVVQPENLALIWPASGVLLGFLLTQPQRSWTFILPAVFGVIVAANLASGNTVVTSLGFGLINCGESLLAAAAVLRLLGHCPRLDESRDVIALIVVAAVACNAVTALAGAMLIHSLSQAPFFGLWIWWWLQDGMGMLLVGPLVLEAGNPQSWRPRPDRWDLGLAVSLATLLVVIFLLPPSSYSHLARPYLPLPLLLYLAIKHGPRGALVGTSTLGVAALIGLSLRAGVFQTFAVNLRDQAMAAQLFLAVSATSALIASAASAERRRAFQNMLASQAALQESQQQLRDYAEAQRVLLREVNHRVKNNLAAILGIVHLEHDRARADHVPGAVQALQDLDVRLRALASVHSLLSQTEWRPVRLDDLARRIVTSAIEAGSPHRAQVRVEDSTVVVDSNQAHHLALALAELATNTLKHGLGPEGVVAQITISRAENQVVVTYLDRGPGYPTALLTGEEQGLVGMELLRGLVRHSLRGRLDLRSDGGAVAVISFPEYVEPGA